MAHTYTESQFFGQEKISKILLKIAPPVMLAQLIQALYNIVDSLFVGRYAESGLTALSIVYPLQLLMIALAVGTGVGINTAMAARFGLGKDREADEFAGVGTPLAAFMWLIFAAVCWFFMPTYAKMSTDSPDVIRDVIAYGRIVCAFSFGLFLESIWTKVLQSSGDMQTCIVPVISFNYAARNIDRCKKTLSTSILFGIALMLLGVLCFETIPGPMLRVFTSNPLVVEIGQTGFRFIGLSFPPLVTSLIFPVFFQAVGQGMKSSVLTVVRTMVLFVPLGFLFSRFGLTWFWLVFPCTEILTTLLGIAFYKGFLRHPYVAGADQ